MSKYILTLILSVFIPISCSQWKVSSLKSSDFAFIKNGDNLGNVKIETDDYALENLSFDIGIFNGNISISDNILKRVQVLEPDGSPILVIGNIANIDIKTVKASDFKFNIIGSFTMDRDDNIYIQNRFTQSKLNEKGTKTFENEDINFSPSYILVFNSDGKLQYTLGQEGTPNIPFYYIETLDIDERGRLFVISRSFNKWSVYRFNNRKRDFYVDLSKIEFKEKDGKNEFNGKIENIKTYNSGDRILISVAFYHGLRLKYRKIYEYIIENKSINREIVNIPDPKNVLFDLIDDKYIYFWDIESRDIRFMICNMQGNIINNIFLKTNKRKNFYSKIISDESGKIYSYHVFKKGIKIIEWN